MNKGTIGLLIAVVAVGSYAVGRAVTHDKGGGSASAEDKAAMNQPQGPSDGVDRIRVPLEGPSKGPATAKVAIVEFSDFQCPFCSRVVPTMQRIEKEYGNQVRIYFR